ncbi:hypothetical protein ARSEF1564_005251 [Beauveria bassiana]
MKLFVILCCLLGKAAADSGNDFVNNLFTDLAPLLALFGERVTQQFMSQSTGWADHILLSMAREIDDKLDAILPLRRDLAEASDWNGPLSSLAIKLAESMDAVMDLCFSSSSFCNDAQWDILLSPQKHRGARYARFHIRRENGRWQNQSDEIDAALSLWIFSREANGRRRFKQLFQSAINKQSGKPTLPSPEPELERFLALDVTDSLDRMYARELLTSFLWAVAERIEDGIPGEVTVHRGGAWSEQVGEGLVSKAEDLDFDIEVRHSGLTKLMEEIHAGGFASLDQKLVDYGAALDRPDKTGNSPIFWAAYKGNNEMFRFLFPRANIQRLCNGGRTLLHAAVIGGSRVIAGMIGEDGRAMINMTAIDEAYMTALEYAVANEDVKMVRYLSTILGPMIEGTSPLDNAIVAAIERDRWTRIDRESANYMEHASDEFETDTESGSDKFESDRVFGSHKFESVRVTMLRVLLSRLEEGSPQLVDAMIEAIREEHDEVVLLLIRDFSCQVDTKSSAGEYPIHVAVKNHCYGILKILVEDGKASLDTKDSNGYTALEYAVALDRQDMKFRNYAIAQQLLELGVEVDDDCFDAIKEDRGEATAAKLAKVLKNFQERHNGRTRRGVESGVPLEDSESLGRKEAGSD